MAVTLSTHSLTQESQDIANNQSVVRYLVKITTSGASHNDNNITTTYYIDGVKYTKTHKLPSNTTTTVVDKTVTITHNSDGTRSVNASFSTPTNISAGTMTGNKTLVLDTIPRASSFTLSKTSGGSSTSSFTLGDNIYVNITRASTSFTHKVYFVVGSSGNQTLSNSATTSANGSLALSLANYIPTTSSTATMYVETYNNGVLIGSSSQTFTINVPSSVVPTISSITTSDTQGRLSVFGAYVQGKSTLRIQTSASGVYGSNIQSYAVQIKNGSTVLQTLSGSDVSLANISYTGNLTVSVTVTDSRGRTATSTASVTVLAYSNPQINTFTITRNNNTPTNVSVAINASIIALNNHNTKSFTLKYKKTSASSWTTVTLSNTNYTLNTTHSLSNIDENSSYDFQLIVADYFASNTRETDLGTVFELINWKSDGTAMALGKVSEISNSFECDLDPYFKKIKLYDSTNTQWVDLEVEVVDTW